MHCVLNYPTKDVDANLSMIVDLKNFKIFMNTQITLPVII